MKRATLWVSAYLLSHGLLAGGLYLFWTFTHRLPWETTLGRTGIGTLGLVWIILCGRGLWGLLDWGQGWRGWAARLIVSLTLLGGVESFIWALSGVPVWQTRIGWLCAAGVAGIWTFVAVLAVARLLLQIPGRSAAVARELLDEAVRMKVALLVLILLLLVLLSLPYLSSGDGTLSGKVQNFLAYSLGLTGLLLSLLTVFLACATVSGELTNRQIHLIASKPIRRWQYLLGKWLGIVVLDAVLLVVIGAGVYAATRWIAAGGQPLNPTNTRRLEQEVLTARQRIDLPASDVEPFVERRFTELKNSDQLLAGQTEEQVKAQLRNYFQIRVRSVHPQRDKLWKLDGLTPLQEAHESFHFRYKVKGQHLDDGNTARMLFRFGDLKKVQPLWLRLEEPHGQQHTHEVPVSVIAPDGTLTVLFHNPGPRQIITFEGDDSIAILYKVGSFGGNFVRSLLAIWIRLMFLAVLGLFAASFLSFPIATLLALSLTMLSFVGPHVLEALQYWQPAGGTGGTELLGGLAGNFARTMIALLPELGAYSPTDRMVDGLIISWNWLGAACLESVVSRGLVLGLIGAWIFSRRELAKVTV